MSTPNVGSIKSRLETLIALARILERVERGSAVVDAGQYQLIAKRLKAALSDTLPQDALRAVLGAYPCAAELYENMQYEHAGLSRAPLDVSVSSEMLASRALARAARSAESDSGTTS